MTITWKHALVVALGAGLPVLFQLVQKEPLLTLPALGHDAASALLVAVSAALRSFLPPAAP